MDEKGWCTHAEIMLVPSSLFSEDNAGNDTASVAAWVENDVENLIDTPVTTAGRQIAGRGLRRAKMTLSTDICWYLVRAGRRRGLGVGLGRSLPLCALGALRRRMRPPASRPAPFEARPREAHV